MGKKCTKAEMINRVRRVGELIAKGASRGDINRFASEMWGCNERTVDTLMQRARDQMQEDWRIDRQALIAEHLARMNLVVKHGFKENDLRSVVAASKYQAELTQTLRARPSGDNHDVR